MEWKEHHSLDQWQRKILERKRLNSSLILLKVFWTYHLNLSFQMDFLVLRFSPLFLSWSPFLIFDDCKHSILLFPFLFLFTFYFMTRNQIQNAFCIFFLSLSDRKSFCIYLRNCTFWICIESFIEVCFFSFRRKESDINLEMECEMWWMIIDHKMFESRDGSFFFVNKHSW